MEGFFNWIAEFFSGLFATVIDFFFSLFSQFMGIVAPYLSAWLIDQGFELEIPTEVFNVLDEITYGIGYIFPLYALLPIVTFWVIFYVAKITISAFNFVTKTISVS